MKPNPFSYSPTFSIPNVVDPDFDDDWNYCTLLQHEVETTGAIELHPDGNRHDQTPLHARHYPDNKIAELTIRELKAFEKQHQEQQQHEQALAETKQEPMYVPPPPPRIGRFTLHDELLYNMRLDSPVPKGLGRVWNGYVMINKTDLGRWYSADPNRTNLPVIWADETRTIFRFT